MSWRKGCCNEKKGKAWYRDRHHGPTVATVFLDMEEGRCNEKGGMV